MAELFTHPEQEDDYLKRRYLWELWTALLEHAPGCLAYLREQGVSAWLERYRLPEGLRAWAEEYHANPEGYIPLVFDFSDAPPPTPRLTHFWEPFTEYDPSRMPPHRWRERAIAWLDCYMEMVEDAFRRAGWEKKRVKYEPEHFVWLALRLEGLTYSRIADLGEKPLTDDAVRKATRRLAQELGVELPDI